MGYRNEINGRVYYGDTDNMQNVYYANYLRWYEQARVEFLRFLNISCIELAKLGFGLPVTEINCRYKSELKLDDEYVVTTKISELTKASITFNHDVICGKRIVNSATIKVAVMDLATRKISRLPNEIYSILEENF